MPRILYFLFALLVLGLGAAGVARLSFNVDLLTLLPRNLPGVEGTVAFQKFHDKADELLITLKSPDGTDVGDIADDLAKCLAAAPGLARRVQSEPAWRTDPGGLVGLAAYSWLNAPPERVRALEADLSPERIDAGLRAKLSTISGEIDPLSSALGSRDPLGLGAVLAESFDAGAGIDGGDSFSSRDGSYHLLKVRTGRDLHGYRETAKWLGQVREVVAGWQSSRPAAAGVKVGYTGSPAFEAEIGSGMESDMGQSVSAITLVVALLFWLLHRSIRMLLFLLLAMLATGLLTMGVAGLTLGSLDVMSMGFAAILMGMIEDFGVMGLHAAMRRPGASFRALHAGLFPPIAWSALTSAAVFASLGLSTLPGIARMGLLSALGILIGAAVMLYGFLPLAMRLAAGRSAPVAAASRRHTAWPGWLALALCLMCAGVLAWRGLPGIDDHGGVMRPRHCQAFEALQDMQQHLQPDQANSIWLPVIIRAQSAPELAASLRQLESRLAAAKATGHTLGQLLPTALAPDPERQAANLPVLARLAAGSERLMRSMDAAGFTDQGTAFARGVLEIWAVWGSDAGGGTRWLPDPLLDDYFGPVLRHDRDGITACGFVRLPKSGNPFESGIVAEIQRDPAVQAGGLDYLTFQLRQMLGGEARRILLPVALALGALLFLVFRGARERLVAVGSLAFSALLLLGVMSAAGIDWNFVSIGAVPLILGLGLDFNIHMIHALRERGVDGHGIGRALAYCGLSTALGFSALGMSDNVGLAVFGQTAMIGVMATLVTAAFFIPWAWGLGAGKPRLGETDGD